MDAKLFQFVMIVYNKWLPRSQKMDASTRFVVEALAAMGED